MEQLDKDTIVQWIESGSHGQTHEQDFDLEVHQQLDSTNSYLLAAPLGKQVRVCLTENQTAGRGRHGKSWFSPEGSNLYLSLAHRLSGEVSELSGFSLVIGITLVETLQKFCQEKIQLKWPNDLLVNGRKLSGILVEIKSEIKNESNDSYRVVSGVGVNLVLPADVDEHIDQPSISLEQCRPVAPLSRNKIAAEIVSNILHNVKHFESRGFGHFHHQWNALDAWYQRPVVLKMGNKTIKGIHQGIDLTGALILEQDGKQTLFSSGEVSLRSDS